MSQFRLHIDVPLGTNQEEAVQLTTLFMSNVVLVKNQEWFQKLGVDVHFRLGNDNDRQKSNYLDINENGHVSTKKCKL